MADPKTADEQHRDGNPTGNPALDVHVISTGIKPELLDQSEAEAVVALDPPGDQVPAATAGQQSDEDKAAAEKAEQERRDRIQQAADEGKEADANKST